MDITGIDLAAFGASIGSVITAVKGFSMFSPGSKRAPIRFKPIEIETASGIKYIARHIAGSRKLEWMYAMHPKVFVPPRWGWQKIVEFFYKKYIEQDIRTAYQKALASAKK